MDPVRKLIEASLLALSYHTRDGGGARVHSQESVSDAFGISRTAHFEASRPVSVRLSVRVRVPCPKAAPIAIEMVKRRTHERLQVQMFYIRGIADCRTPCAAPS